MPFFSSLRIFLTSFSAYANALAILMNIFDGYEYFDAAVCETNAVKIGVSKIETVFTEGEKITISY